MSEGTHARTCLLSLIQEWMEKRKVRKYKGCSMHAWVNKNNLTEIINYSNPNMHLHTCTHLLHSCSTNVSVSRCLCAHRLVFVCLQYCTYKMRRTTHIVLGYILSNKTEWIQIYLHWSLFQWNHLYIWNFKMWQKPFDSLKFSARQQISISCTHFNSNRTCS